MKISVIIPFKDKVDLTRECLVSFLECNDDVVSEIILIDNNSSLESHSAITGVVSEYGNVQLLSYPYPYNFQKICNFGALHSDGEVLYFLNNDTEFVLESRGLLAKMAERCIEERVGAVGSLLLYEDGVTVQHAGVFFQAGGYAGHIGAGLEIATTGADVDKYVPLFPEGRRVSAVTAASLVVERRKFDDVGGFSEEFLVCGGDVDLCIKLTLAGYHSYCIDSGYIIHKESRSVKGMQISMVDFVLSYKSYSRSFDIDKGDLFHTVNGDA